MTGPTMGGGAFGLPSPTEDPLVAAIRGLLPERTAEERALGFVGVTFGTGETAASQRIPVLFHAANGVWQEKFKAAFRGLFDDLSADDTGAVMTRLLLGETESQLELLEAFQPQMLSRAWVEEHATEEQILDAFLKVTAAAFPTPVALARVLLANQQVARWVRQMLIQTLYATSMPSSGPSTASPPEPSTKP